MATPLLGRFVDLFVESGVQVGLSPSATYRLASRPRFGVLSTGIASDQLAYLSAELSRLIGVLAGDTRSQLVEPIEPDLFELDQSRYDVLVILAGARAEPALAALSVESLRRRGYKVVLVGAEQVTERRRWQVRGVDAYVPLAGRILTRLGLTKLPWVSHHVALKRVAELCLVLADAY